MLVLSRKENQSIVIDGRIVVKVLRIVGDSVKLGIEASADIPVHRQEIYDMIKRNTCRQANESITIKTDVKDLPKQSE